MIQNPLEPNQRTTVPTKINIRQLGRKGKLRIRDVQRIAETVLAGEKSEHHGELNIVFLNNTEIRKMNAQFLGKDRVTDVIAFPLFDEEDDIWGELYIGQERAAEQAVEYNVTYEEELSRLVIHGMLHLLGYEDGDESGKRRMHEKENAYLQKLQ